MMVRTRPLDCNDGAARRAAPEKGPDPKLQNESCRQVSPSQVRDACGPHDGNKYSESNRFRWRSFSATT
jgi:hypothetical protein